MKKICHVLITYGNKNQNYTTDFLDELNKSKHGSHFIFCHTNLSNNSNLNVFVSNNLSLISFSLLFLKQFIIDKNIYILKKKIGIGTIYKWIELLSMDIDVIHIHHLHAIPIEIIEYFKVKNIRIICSLRGRDLLVNTLDEVKARELVLKLRKMDFIHTISEHMASELKSKFNLESKYIYRSVQSPKSENIKIDNVVNGVIQLIAVGRLVWEKGHIYLIESIYRLVKKGHNLKLDIYGDGPLKEFLDFRINQLGLCNNICLKGFVENDQLKTFYKNYNLAIQPSLSEALSNGLLDLMVHNLPCVISNVGGMVEIIDNQLNGIIYNVNEPSQIDEAILKCIELDFNLVEKHNYKKSRLFSKHTEIENFNTLYLK